MIGLKEKQHRFFVTSLCKFKAINLRLKVLIVVGIIKKLNIDQNVKVMKITYSNAKI